MKNLSFEFNEDEYISDDIFARYEDIEEESDILDLKEYQQDFEEDFDEDFEE